MESARPMRRIVVVGATSTLAERCARLWAAREPVHLTLVARDVAKAERIASDLRVRGIAALVDVRSLDFLDPAAIGALATSVAVAGPIDTVLVAHGSLPDQSRCETDLVACRDALVVNAVSPALFAEAFAAGFARAGRGHLVVLGSVAGDRGRKSNYAYGAAKGLLDRYTQGLQHRFAATDVRVTLVKPGPTDTPMTTGMKARGMKLADPDDVARRIVAAADRGAPVVYAPARWALIMRVIRSLPRFVFHRINV